MVDLEFVGDYRNPQPLTARQRELGHDGQSSGDFTFDDFLDIINPLQHIPLVSTLYREITGDEISPHARILGDTLFGGASGFVAAAANVLFEEIAGEDIGQTVMAWFSDEEAAPDSLIAAGTPAQDPAPALLSDPAASDLMIPAAAVGLPLPTAAGPLASGPLATDPLATDLKSSPPSHGSASGETPDGLLTGDAALQALFNDLRGSPAAGPALPPAPHSGVAQPAAEVAAKSYPLPPRPAGPAMAPVPATAPAPAKPRTAAGEGPEQAAVHPLIVAQESAKDGIAGRMMEALDKYRMMSQQRQGGPAQGPDEEERARRNAEGTAAWQSDPAPADPWNFDPATPAGG